MIKHTLLLISFIISFNLSSQVSVSPVLDTQKLAIVPFDYALDSGHTPIAIIDSAFFNAPSSMKAFFEEASYGKITLDGRVYPYRRNQPPLFGVGYTNCYPTDAVISNQADVDYTSIDGIVLLPYDTASGKSCGAGNSSFGKLPFTTTNGPQQFRRSGFRTSFYFPNDFSNTTSSTVAHELLHSFGNGFHSNSYVQDSGVWKVQGYGNVFDILGLRSQASHPCSMLKHKLGWLTSNEIQYVTQTDTFRIYPLEQTLAGQTQCLIIDLNDKLDLQPNDTFKFGQLYLEYRGLTGFDSRTSFQRRVRLKNNTYFQNSNPHGLSIIGVDCDAFADCRPILIDMHPAPIGGVGAAYFPHEASDAPLKLNESYQVATADSISIKVVAVNPGNYIDVAITMPTSVHLNKNQNSLDEFNLYPNPTADFLHIEGLEGDYEIQLFDVYGKLLASGLSKGGFDMSEFESGVYILSVQDRLSNERIEKRLIKQ
ncbi:MAG: T9SS type A sorting domain-containing protein [Vicingaceae bacterium]